MFENVDWTVILSAVLGLISVVAGTFWYKVQGRLAQFAVVAKEFVDVVKEFERSLSDNSLTKEEVEAIKKEFDEVKVAFKLLISKEQA